MSVINKVKFKNSNTYILKYLTILLYNLYRTYFSFIVNTQNDYIGKGKRK